MSTISTNQAIKRSFETSSNSASVVSRTSVTGATVVTFPTSKYLAQGENTSGSFYGQGFYGGGDRYGGLDHFKNRENYSISR